MATDLVILEAQYGCQDHRLDVTRQLNDAIEDGKLHVFVGNQLGGDPCPNASKDLTLKYNGPLMTSNVTVCAYKEPITSFPTCTFKSGIRLPALWGLAMVMVELEAATLVSSGRFT